MFKAIKNRLTLHFFYPFLLPVFFVLHNYLLYYGLVSVAVALIVLLKIELAFALFFLGLMLFLRHAQRSAQLTALVGFMILFYGVIKDFFSKTLSFGFLAKYTVLPPILLAVTLLMGWRVLRKKNFDKSNLFQNMLLLLFLLIEGLWLSGEKAAGFMQHNQLVKNNVLTTDHLPVAAERPDVYFLVFDSYPGTRFLRDYLQYHNTLDTILARKGFYVAARPSSNYNRTAFSMAATLNMEYLQSVPDKSVLEPRQYNQASLSIQHALVPAVFLHNGYQLYNLSVFDVANQPALQRENFLVLPEENMLLYNTFPERFMQDVAWHFFFLQAGGLHPSDQQQPAFETLFLTNNLKKRELNNRAIDSLLKMPLTSTGRPRFVYAHLYLPHPPFFYDSNGSPLAVTRANVEAEMEKKDAFISYLEYTNKVIKEIVDTLLRSTQRQPVIIIQSDHGYRDFRKEFVSQDNYFKNYSAFYFPDKNYSSLYDTISNINTFPVVFNKYFNTHIPMQKDSTVFNVY